MAKLVKIVSPQGEWYEEIADANAYDLEINFGSQFEVNIEQVLEAFGHTTLIFGRTVSPENLTPDDEVIGVCRL